MSLSWVACSAKTGIVICRLPDLSVSKISAAICSYSTTSGTLPITDKTNPDWERGTLHGGTYLVALDNGVPKQGYLVNRRPRPFGQPVELGLTSVEAYMDRRFVREDISFLDHDQCDIIEGLVDLYVRDSFPIRVQATASAITRDRTYLKSADKSIYSALIELAGVINGPEFTVGWETSILSGQRAYTPVLYVADRLGSAPGPTGKPAVTFRYPGSVSSGKFTEDYSTGAGANDVLAVSTASADVRPESSHAIYADVLRPTFESRITPSDGISVIATLDSHAQANLDRVKDGAISIEMTLDYGSAPKPGDAWNIGDTVGFKVKSPEFPGGLTGTARARGWTINDGPTPTLDPFLTEVQRG
jgi:hypothetical protein